MYENNEEKKVYVNPLVEEVKEEETSDPNAVQVNPNPGVATPNNREHEKPKYTKIEVAKLDFISSIKTTFTTTSTLSRSITDALKQVSDDVVACLVYTRPRNEIIGSLILTDARQAKGKSKFVFATNSRNTARISTLDMIRAEGQKRKRYLHLTEDAKTKLEEFIPETFTDGNKQYFNFNPNHVPNWNSDIIVKEFPEASGLYGQTQMYLAVQFDVRKWLGKVYGDKGENGAKLEYIISAIRPENVNVVPFAGQKSLSYIISITQADRNELRRCCERTTGRMPNIIYPSFYAF